MSESAPILANSSNPRKTLSKRSSRLVPIRTPGGVVIGQIVIEDGRRVFVRRVSEKRHLFRLHDGWPLGAFALDQCQRWKISTLRYVTTTGETYEAPLDYFFAQAIAMEFPHETQFVLPRSLWPVQPASLSQAKETSAQEQLALEISP